LRRRQSSAKPKATKTSAQTAPELNFNNVGCTRNNGANKEPVLQMSNMRQCARGHQVLAMLVNQINEKIKRGGISRANQHLRFKATLFI